MALMALTIPMLSSVAGRCLSKVSLWSWHLPHHAGGKWSRTIAFALFGQGEGCVERWRHSDTYASGRGGGTDVAAEICAFDGEARILTMH